MDSYLEKKMRRMAILSEFWALTEKHDLTYDDLIYVGLNIAQSTLKVKEKLEKGKRLAESEGSAHNEVDK